MAIHGGTQALSVKWNGVLGSRIMKIETILQIIDQQKAKMTSEQFWCVVLVSGAFSALILNSNEVASKFHSTIVVSLSVLAAAWGIIFVWNRHKYYEELQGKFCELVADETDVPENWKMNPYNLKIGKKIWEWVTGVGSYMVIIGIMMAAVVACYF